VVDEVYQLIRANYVDTVNEKRLMGEGVKGMMENLDPIRFIYHLPMRRG